jgi:hypothetical protein
MKKFACPEFLPAVVTQEAYERWLHRKAQAHVRRDRGRKNTTATVASYKAAIHQAVCASLGSDAYTNETLAWNLLSTYDNDKSKKQGRAYKAHFALLPTVDHIGDGTGPADFKICAWRTNDAKNDLPLGKFVELCRKVVEANQIPAAHGGEKGRNDDA